MKKGAMNSMAEAMQAMNDPAVMAEAMKMMKDPQFVQQIQAMQNDPDMRRYMAAVSVVHLAFFVVVFHDLRHILVTDPTIINYLIFHVTHQCHLSKKIKDARNDGRSKCQGTN